MPMEPFLCTGEERTVEEEGNMGRQLTQRLTCAALQPVFEHLPSQAVRN